MLLASRLGCSWARVLAKRARMREFCQCECPQRVNTHETSARTSRVNRFVTSLANECFSTSLPNESQKVLAKGNNNECDSTSCYYPYRPDRFRTDYRSNPPNRDGVNAANNNQQRRKQYTTINKVDDDMEDNDKTTRRTTTTLTTQQSTTK